MSPSSENRPAAPESEVRTFRGSTIEELIPQIRAELGPGAIILRERQGLTGGVGGFFARRCVEIDAQAAPRVSVYAGDDEDPEVEDADLGRRLEREAPSDLADLDEERELDEAEYEAASTPPGFAERLAIAEAARAEVTPPAAVPTPEPARSPFAAARPTGAPRPTTPAFIAFDELAPAAPANEMGDMGARSGDLARSPATAPRDILIPIAVQVAPVPVAPVFRPRVRATEPVGTPQPPVAAPQPPATTPSLAPQPPVAPTSTPPDALVARLTDGGLSPELAEEIIRSAAAAVPDDPGALLDAARSVLAAALPTPTALPASGAVAVVGSGGSGKTRSVAGLASALARAGQPVTVARLGGVERGLELAELLGDEDVELIPAMRTQATARAVASARTRGLVLVDTASTSPGDHASVEVLAETLAPFALDGVLLCAPTTFTARALQRLADSHAGLPIQGLVATHADEGSDIGAVVELSIRSGIPVAHQHAGLDVARSVSPADPARLAEELLR